MFIDTPNQTSLRAALAKLAAAEEMLAAALKVKSPGRFGRMTEHSTIRAAKRLREKCLLDVAIISKALLDSVDATDRRFDQMMGEMAHMNNDGVLQRPDRKSDVALTPFPQPNIDFDSGMPVVKTIDNLSLLA